MNSIKETFETKVRKSMDVVRKSMDVSNRPKRVNFENLETHENTRFRFKLGFFALALRSLGVIYGDIGTSPLYVMNTIFTSEPTPDQVIGGTSLVVWSLIILVTLKYVIFILQADNVGEGGTFALASLLVGEQSTLPERYKKIPIFLSLVGAAFVIADGSLTPAVSVLSAIEGLEVFNESFSPFVLPVAIIILILLFLAQRFGTSKVGITFGPIMLLWFSALLIIGCYHLKDAPVIFSALNPWEGITFLYTQGSVGFLSLGAVFLAVTGLEALYADLGHFGPASIRVSWLFLVLPPLILNYLGQGALLISDPTTVSAPFFLSIPTPVYWPMFILSTVATIIASQAMITGCFSLVSQAISLGFFPPVEVLHTSKQIIGQIYIPTVNYFLMILTVLVIAGFQQSSSITQAYGVTVCSVMCLTSVLFMLVMKFTWCCPWWKTLPFCLFLIVDFFFLAANVSKIPTGGWVSILFGIIFSCIMLVWYFGERELKKAMAVQLQTANIASLKEDLRKKLGVEEEGEEEGEEGVKEVKSLNYKSFTMKEEEDSSIESKSDSGEISVAMDIPVLPEEVKRIPGVGVFLTPNKTNIPTVFQLFVNYIHGVPETIIFLTLEHVNIPFVPSEFKTEVTKYGSGIVRVVARYGYGENKVKITDVLESAFNSGLTRMNSYTVYFEKEHVAIKRKNIPFRILLYVYSIFKKLFSGATGNFQLPSSNVMAIGVRVEL